MATSQSNRINSLSENVLTLLTEADGLMTGRAVDPGHRRTDDAELSRLAPIFGRWSRRNLDPYADRLDLADGEVEIASGVHVLAAPGHTPGHIAVALRSEGSELLYVSDAALHPIHLEHPEWRSVWDQEPDDALATRRRLFDHAASDGSTVLAFHFPPFPSLGRVEKRGSGWHWEPVSLETPF